MENKIEKTNFDTGTLERFSQLDDIDILAALKKWQYHDDFVLSKLCGMIIHRRLLTIKMKSKPIAIDKLDEEFKAFKKLHSLSDEETGYFVFKGKIENRAYNLEKQNINILKKDGKLKDVAKASDHLNLKTLSKKVTKYYICYPKESV